MQLTRRLAPVAAMGITAILYVLVRPAILASAPGVAILEFPIAAAMLSFLLWSALKRPKPQPTPEWRKHAQVVRPLPDPALAPFTRALEEWLDTGRAPEAAARTIAAARSYDDREREAIEQDILPKMRSLSSRRQRGSLLKEQLGVRSP